MKSIQPFSGAHWIVTSHTFKPHPWKQIIVMGSGLTHQTARDAYQAALAKVSIPKSQVWMWWRRREGSVDCPFIGVGMT